MRTIAEDFRWASKEEKIRYCVNRILEASDANQAERKIRETLRRMGADEEILAEAFALAREQGAPPERKKAERLAAERLRDCSQENPPSPQRIRRLLAKLAYAGFEEEILEEIREKLAYQYDLEDFFS